MARLRITSTDASTIPTPPAGKSTIFLDSADMSFKAKLPDGSLIPISATEEYIQDIVGNLFQDSSTIDFTYTDAGNTVSMEVIQTALDIFQIPNIPVGNLTSNTVGEALNELQSSIDTGDAALQGHLDDPSDAHDASAISFDNSANTLTTDNSQDAIVEVNVKLDAHLNGGASKHDATEIDYERANVNKKDIQDNSIEVESALSDLDDNKLSRSGNQSMVGALDMGGNDINTGVGLVDGRDVSVDGTKLDTIESNAKDDQIASEVPVTPVGGLTSNQVQGALEEHQSDIDLINTNFEERAQDAVGNIFTDTPTVEITYNDLLNIVSAIVPAGGITNLQVASGIDALKIGSGNISNTEFEALDNISGNIQSLLNLKLNLSGGTMVGGLILNADPTQAMQAATKQYVDNSIQGLKAKDAVRAATTGPLTLSSDFENGDTIDGVTLVTGDRILIKNQALSEENGIYEVQASGIPLRTSDADTFDELAGAFVFVSEGALLSNTGWTCSAQVGGVLDTDPLPWIQFSAAGVVTVDGLGLIKVGNEIQLVLDGGTLSKSGSGLKVASLGVDTSELADLSVTNGKIANDTITNIKIAAGAAIAFSKLQTLTINRATVTNSSGVIVASVITQTELEALDNISGNIQDQLDDKTPISHLDGDSSKHDATEIDYERANVNKKDIQASSVDIENAINDLDDLKYSTSNPSGFETPTQLNSRDTSNRARANHTGTQLSNTISDFAATVRSTVLTGLSLAIGTAITAADSVLSALGKLQTQITNNLTTLSNHISNTSNPHSVTKTQVGLGNVDNTSDADKPISDDTQAALDLKYNSSNPDDYQTDTEVQAAVDAHANLTNNPHGVTKTQVGLGNVDNTSDINKPISSATQTALDLKYNSSNPSGYETPSQLNTRDINNRNRTNHTGTQLAATISDFGSSASLAAPVQSVAGKTGVVTLVKADVGLGNVDNTSDADKPISDDTQSALNGKQPIDTDLTAVANLTGTGFVTRTGTGTATTRTIQGTSGNINVSNGDGVSGNPTIDLPDVGAGAGSVGAAASTISITTDVKGRVISRTAQAISILSSQVSNFATSVRATVLTGFALGTNSTILATDTILQAFGKIQAQINERISGPASSIDNAIVRYDGVTGKLAQNSGASVDDNGGVIAGNFIRPSDTSDTTNANIRYNNNELQGRVNGIWRNLSIIPSTISQTGNTSTTSGTYGVITGMTTTPAAGTYMVLFECSTRIGDDTSGDISFFIGATIQDDSTKTLEAQANGGFGPSALIEVPTTMISFLTVNGSQAINVQFRENGGGTLTIGPRKLTLIPISR